MLIARDAVASDHLVYAWPFPIGPEEYEVACADDELVVMCPSWIVGDRLGPGRHRWRTPDPMRPVSAFFVLTSPVEVSFDMQTTFVMPQTGATVRLHAAGSLQVRCGDPALLIAQFVGLPFDHVNEGVLRSVSRSVERMIARLLTRRVVMAGTPAAVTDPAMLPAIVEELVAYNPAAGAVFGIELMRMGHLTITADDGTQPQRNGRANGETERVPPPRVTTPPELLETMRAPRAHPPGSIEPPPLPPPSASEPGLRPSPLVQPRAQSSPPVADASGEIVMRGKPAATPAYSPPPVSVPVTPPAPARKVGQVEVPSVDDITQPGVQIVRTPVPGAMRLATPQDAHHTDEPRGAILGIGTSHIGHVGASQASGEIPTKIAPGARVLVPGPNGLMQSATVRQLLQGYYELEVGSSGETIWVPMNGVVPE
ncbi:MAG TPA: hypothetical protein VLX92_10335 [Kofleriaceae bacterium]|nr:hypothetical protein [Kofleriaceae bacterium]